MMLNSNFPKKKFYKEQYVVVEENIKNQNIMNIMLGEQVESIIYSGSSYAYPIDTLSYHPKSDSLKYEDVVKWYECYYKPSNFVYSIVSNLSFKTVLQFLESSIFVKTQEKPCVSHSAINLSLQQYTAPQIYLEKKNGVSTNSIYIGFRTCSKDSTDRYVLKVLKHVLNGMSGRLFTILREDNGLTYISSCNTEHFEHTGYFLVYVETDPDNRSAVLSLLIKMFQNLKTHGITAEELSVAKGNIRGKRITGMENNDKIADYNGRELLLNNGLEKYEDIFSHHIAKITKEDVFKAIQKYFIPGNMVLGIMGETVPVKKTLEKTVRI
jgi:zinc protease